MEIKRGLRFAGWMSAVALMASLLSACNGVEYDPHLPAQGGVAEHPNGGVPHDLKPAAVKGCAVKPTDKCQKPYMEPVARSVVGAVEDFYTSIMPGSPPTFAWIPSGTWKRNECKDDLSAEHPQKVEGRFLFYCGVNDRVYVGQGNFWGMYDRYGYQVPYVVLGHEGAHSYQYRVKKQYNELQADCFAGAFIGYARMQDWLDPEINPIDQAITMFQDVAESVGEEGKAHGTLQERRQWMQAGLAQGPKHCVAAFDVKLSLK